MRIISGKFKGFRYDPPIRKWPTRPTMDQAREALFNVLANRILFENQIVLDLFGGTGSISLEFISRGTEKVYFLEKHTPCITYLKKLADKLDIKSKLELIRGDGLKYLQKTDQRFTLIFMDPPYDYPHYPKLVEIVLERNLLENHGILIMEHDARIDFGDHPALTDVRKYGDSYFSFFSAT